MMNKVLFAILITSTLISCGDKKNNNVEGSENTTNTPIVIVDPLRVTLDAIVPENDTLEIYYRFDANSDYESGNVVKTVVAGQDSAQNITFNLPTEKRIYDFRIDFGNNKKQSDIQIKNFNMQFKGNSLNVKDTLFYQYFWNNEFIDYTRDKAIIKPKEVSGNYDPIFMPREVLVTEIDKVFNPPVVVAPTNATQTQTQGQQ